MGLFFAVARGVKRHKRRFILIPTSLESTLLAVSVAILLTHPPLCSPLPHWPFCQSLFIQSSSTNSSLNTAPNSIIQKLEEKTKGIAHPVHYAWSLQWIVAFNTKASVNGGGVLCPLSSTDPTVQHGPNCPTRSQQSSIRFIFFFFSPLLFSSSSTIVL